MCMFSLGGVSGRGLCHQGLGLQDEVPLGRSRGSLDSVSLIEFEEKRGTNPKGLLSPMGLLLIIPFLIFPTFIR